ncbi:single-stranded DNA-binding protein, partial [Proteus mirabilis]
PQAPQASSNQAPQSEPPMDFEDDIPFAPIGLPYPRHAIYVI